MFLFRLLFGRACLFWFGLGVFGCFGLVWGDYFGVCVGIRLDGCLFCNVGVLV